MRAIEFDYDALWVEVDLDAEPRSWARAVLAGRREDEGLEPRPALDDALVDGLAQVVETLAGQDPPPAMAFSLLPRADHAAVATVVVRALPAEPGETLDDVAEQLRVPAEMLEQPARQEVVSTAAGPALSLVQRFREPVAPGIEQVEEQHVHAWLIAEDPDERLLLLASTTFLDLVEAHTWGDAVRELVRSLHLVN